MVSIPTTEYCVCVFTPPKMGGMQTVPFLGFVDKKYILPTPLDKTRVLFISAHRKYKLRLIQWPFLIDNVYFRLRLRK